MKRDLIPLLKRNLIPILGAVIFLPPIIKPFIPRGITLKATDGSKIYFKSENVSCKWGSLGRDIYYGGQIRHLECMANGVRTYLNGATTNYSDYSKCRSVNEEGKDLVYGFNENSFPCTAARKLGKY